MAMPDVGKSAQRSSLQPALWVLVGLVTAAVVAAVGWRLWGGETHKVSQAAAKGEVTRALDSMVQATGVSRQNYTSAVALQHCDNGVGGYDGWEVYAGGAFEHQTQGGAVAMANVLSAYLRRAGYSGVKQTVDAQTVRVDGTKGGVAAVLHYDASDGLDQIIITAGTGCDIVPDPADTTAVSKIIG
ncbi:hypothetical protein [Catenulispora pinisilvae]|uniref:hypothetical protein n=1 Tax=Catenulispora pinisilvae TaxID=2705253 RepID=UPI001890D8B4|nr:hypothetical protein [Catenulispora pinisilvae]